MEEYPPQVRLAASQNNKRSRKGLVIGLIAAILLACCVLLVVVGVVLLVNAPAKSLTDDFSTTNGYWIEETSEGGVVEYKNETLSFSVKQDYWLYSPLQADPVTDVVLSVDTQHQGGSTDNDFGLVCRQSGPGSFYYGVISSDGFAGIAIAQDGQFSLLGQQTLLPFEAINQGGTNELTFRCEGNTLSLLVNGKLVAKTTDTTYSVGGVGLLASTSAELTQISFDNFKMVVPK